MGIVAIVDGNADGLVSGVGEEAALAGVDGVEEAFAGELPSSTMVKEPRSRVRLEVLVIQRARRAWGCCGDHNVTRSASTLVWRMGTRADWLRRMVMGWVRL